MQDKVRVYLCIVLTIPLLIPMVLMLFNIHLTLPIYLQFTLATIVQFYGGWHFYNVTFKGLKKGNMSMDTLIVLGSSAAWGFSTYLAITQQNVEHAVYYESSAVIITAILIGKYIEKKSKKNVSSSLSYLFKLIPNMAFVEKNNIITSVNVTDIQINDIVIVSAGESIAVDGIILSGEAYVNETIVTGESNPVYKTINDAVIGGTINNDGTLKIKVIKIGTQTVLANIIKLIRLAQFTKAPIENIADKVSSIFIPIIIALSSIVFLVWWLVFNDVYGGLSAAITVLIITCPCALGLAVPTVLMVALSDAAKNGMLIKNAEVLEKAHNVDTVVFDKTGTLTTGQLAVESITPNTDSNFTKDTILYLAASAMQSASHPISKSIVEYAIKNNIKLSVLRKYENKPGKGLTAIIDTTNLVIGNKTLMNDYNINVPELTDNKSTLVYIGARKIEDIEANDTTSYIGLIKLSDTIKEDSLATITALNKIKVTSILLSGDNADTVKHIAHKLNINKYYHSMSPEDKTNIVLDLRDKENKLVLMVGDGINDSPALANSYVSVAMASGANVTIDVADVVLVNSNTNNIPALLYLSKATVQKIKQNLAWAFIYNIIAVPYAALGLLNPAVAGIAMGLSSISVIINSMLLKNWRYKYNKFNKMR